MHPQKDMQGYQYSLVRLYPVDFYVGPRIWHIHTLAARVYPSEYTALFVWRELCASVNAQPFGLLERVLLKVAYISPDGIVWQTLMREAVFYLCNLYCPTTNSHRCSGHTCDLQCLCYTYTVRWNCHNYCLHCQRCYNHMAHNLKM